MPSTASEHLNENQVLRAGAGAGKTYNLTHKVMELAEQSLAQKQRLPRLVVTTFTRKATEELRERLLLLALEEHPHLVDFVSSRAHLVVSTIHGVMDLYLKRYGAVLRLDPSYQVVSEAEAGKIARQVLRLILFHKRPEFKTLLGQFQFSLLVKYCRQLDLLRLQSPNARPTSFEDLQSIARAQAQMTADRLTRSAGAIRTEASKESWLSIADGFERLSRCLRAADFSATTAAELAEIFQALPTIRKPGKGAWPVSPEILEEAKQVRKLAQKFLQPEYDWNLWTLAGRWGEEINQLSGIFAEEFHQAKRTRGGVEISDLELLAMEAMRKDPLSFAAFAAEWDHWLIDEFQDTSPFQVRLLANLVADRPCYVVGDPQQSIYLFRGARSEVFAQREKEVAEAGGRVRYLPVNRRSRPELLLFLNEFFSSFHPPFRAMEPFYGDGEERQAAQRPVATIHISGSMPDDSHSSADIERDEASLDDGGGGDGDDEAQGSDAEMKALICHVQSLLKEGAQFDEICILGRTKKVLTETAEWLTRYQLPCQVHAGAWFYDRREIRDALAFLKFLINPHDNFNSIELLRSPWFRLPDRDLAQVTAQKPESIWQGCIEMPSRSEAILRLQSSQASRLVLGISETFRRGLIAAGFFDLAHHHDASGRRESNLWKLLSRLQQEESRAGFNPLEFMRTAIQELAVDEGNAEGDAVAAVEPKRINLMTVHASKGLEFRHVLLPRMEAKPRLTTSEELTFDEAQEKWSIRVPFGPEQKTHATLLASAWLEKFRLAEIDEHARVLYVALTRAIDSVYLSWTGVGKQNSWAERVALSLDEGLHQTANFSYRVSREIQEPEVLSKTLAPALEPRERWRTTASVSSESSSVTDIVGRSPASSPKHLQSLLRAAARGSSVHRLLELLKYPVARHRLSDLIDQWFPGQIEQVTQALDFVRTCQNPPLLDLMRNGETEWGFSCRLPSRGKPTSEEQTVDGQIDLWGRAESGELWVVDYKTGSEEFRDKAFAQMTVYAQALRQAGVARENEPIQGAAVYPFSEKVFIFLLENEPFERREGQ